MLTKSSFKSYLQCPAYYWFTVHKPEVLVIPEMNDFDLMLASQGKIVEAEFYKLYPGAYFITSKGVDAVNETKQFEQEGAMNIAQAAFMTDEFFAQSDLVLFKGEKHIEIYEIKSSSSMQNVGQEDAKQAPSREDHIDDLAFQFQVATQAGYLVDRMFLVELNKLYIRNGNTALNKLFDIKEVTGEVLKISGKMHTKMLTAAAASHSDLEPITCECRYLPRKKQCPAFAHLYPDLISYNVYDLAIGKSPKRLRELVDASIFRIENIPSDFEMTNSFRDQVITWNENREIILSNDISEILEGLTYPLYFLDYETTAPAIPNFEGTRPYQHIPFQYSLHVIQYKGDEPLHLEYLHPTDTPPMTEIVNSLRNHINTAGSIIVWHKPFEIMCNKNLSELVPSMRDFLLELNERIYDLKEIFSNHLYVHKDFRGSASIKKVLPVLVPQLSYDSLAIKDGGTATTEWRRMVGGHLDQSERQHVDDNLRKYCELDTLAMVEIYKVLVKNGKP